MLDKMIHITVGEKEYPIAFTLNIMEQIQEKYGSLNQWVESLEKNGEPVIKNLIWSFHEMFNEGIEIENEDTEIKRTKLEHKQVGRIITKYGFVDAGIKLREAFLAMMPKVNDEDPNEKASPTPQ